jgi:putative transcriptional regulator
MRQKMNTSDVALQTGLNRSIISLLYHEKAILIELEVIKKLCGVFRCELGNLLEIKEMDGE